MDRVLEEEMGLNVSGMDFSIPCPFHNDDNPSLRIYPNSDDGMGSFYCFGCGKYGRAVDFVKFYRGLGWTDLKDYVLRKYGVSLVKEDDSGKHNNRDRGLSDILKRLASSEEFTTNPYRIKAVEVSIFRYLKGSVDDMFKCLEKATVVNGDVASF